MINQLQLYISIKLLTLGSNLKQFYKVEVAYTQSYIKSEVSTPSNDIILFFLCIFHSKTLKSFQHNPSIN